MPFDIVHHEHFVLLELIEVPARHHAVTTRREERVAVHEQVADGPLVPREHVDALIGLDGVLPHFDQRVCARGEHAAVHEHVHSPHGVGVGAQNTHALAGQHLPHSQRAVVAAREHVRRARRNTVDRALVPPHDGELLALDGVPLSNGAVVAGAVQTAPCRAAHHRQTRHQPRVALHRHEELHSAEVPLLDRAVDARSVQTRVHAQRHAEHSVRVLASEHVLKFARFGGVDVHVAVAGAAHDKTATGERDDREYAVAVGDFEGCAQTADVDDLNVVPVRGLAARDSGCRIRHFGKTKWKL
eukprot:PhM_4_TR17080/c0_g1_i2/m.58510